MIWYIAIDIFDKKDKKVGTMRTPKELAIFPRIGEAIEFKNIIYRVKDVIYNIDGERSRSRIIVKKCS